MRKTLLLGYVSDERFAKDEEALRSLSPTPLVRRVFARESFLEHSATLAPALVILEEAFDPQANLLKNLKAKHPDLRVLFIFDDVNSPLRETVLNQGATEFLRCALEEATCATLFSQSAQRVIGQQSLRSNLRAVEKQLRSLVQNSNDAVYIIKGNTFIFANPRFKELLGFSQRELLAEDFSIEHNIIAPESRPTLLERQERAQKGLPLEPRYDFVALKKSGETFDAQVSVSYITFQGEPATLGIITDITGRKQFEKMLLRKNRELGLVNDLAKAINRAVELQQTLVIGCRKAAALLNANAVGISLLSDDRQSLELRIQEGLSEEAITALAQLSATDNSLLAHTLRTDSVQLVHDIRTDPRVSVDAIRQSSFKGAIVVPLRAEDRMLGVAYFLTPPGVELYEEEIELMTSIGHLLGTSIHKAELLENSRAAFSRLRAVDEIALTIMSSLDPDEVASKVAQRITKLFGCDRIVIARWTQGASLFEPILATENNQHVGTRSVGRGETLMGRLLDTGEPAQCVHPRSPRGMAAGGPPPPPYEEMLFNQGYGAAIALPIMGESRLLGALHLAFKEPIPLGDPEIDALITLATHLAIAIRNAELFESRKKTLEELKAAQTQLLQSERLNALGELAAGVAHDFNNVLGAISGRAQILARTLDQEDLLKHALVIQKAAHDGAETVRRVQELGRQETTDDFTDVDVAEILRDVYEFTMPKWREHAQREGRKVEVVLAPHKDVRVRGNPHELREVLVNLVHNAIDALPSGGTVTLGVRHEDNFENIYVSDDGTGIADDVKAKIFDPFFTTKGDKGTGLGLSVSYSIIKRHGGELKVDERKDAPGTVFTIRLPKKIVLAEHIQAVARKALPEGCARVLVIDDEENIREILSDILESGGHEVTTAEDGEIGLTELDNAAFDLVLTDLSLPGLDGFEISEAIKKRYPRVHVGLVSGWGARIDEERARALGIGYLLSKPFRFEQVIDIVDQALAGRLVPIPS